TAYTLGSSPAAHGPPARLEDPARSDGSETLANDVALGLNPLRSCNSRRYRELLGYHRRGRSATGRRRLVARTNRVDDSGTHGRAIGIKTFSWDQRFVQDLGID